MERTSARDAQAFYSPARTRTLLAPGRRPGHPVSKSAQVLCKLLAHLADASEHALVELMLAAPAGGLTLPVALETALVRTVHVEEGDRVALIDSEGRTCRG